MNQPFRVDGGPLSRGVALFGQRVADLFAGISHVIRLGLAGGVAAIVTEADAFEELPELPCFSVRQRDSDLDGVLVTHDARPSVGLDVAATGIDLSLDAPGEAAVFEQTSQFQGTIKLIQATSVRVASRNFLTICLPRFLTFWVAFRVTTHVFGQSTHFDDQSLHGIMSPDLHSALNRT